MGLNGRKGGFKFGFGPKRTPGASFVKIGLGPPTAHTGLVRVSVSTLSANNDGIC